MREIQASVAKEHWAELLRVVEHGETIAITRYGKLVAYLVPSPAQERAYRQRAVERFRQRRAGWERGVFSTEEILAARHEGHRLLASWLSKPSFASMRKSLAQIVFCIFSKKTGPWCRTCGYGQLAEQ